ncbi:MAG: hypothetical protein IPP81_12750 [Chitinophagaceae bacterium]|nr:hypothetical protein [Chitinophagaceae bacterium]
MRTNLPMGRMIFLTTLFIISISLQSRSQSVSFSGSNYANAGNAAALHVTNFTLEAWVKIEGTGATTSSGSGGVTLVPLLQRTGGVRTCCRRCKLYFWIRSYYQETGGRF